MGTVGEALRFGGGYLPAFVLTWVIETIVYLAAFKKLGFLADGAERRLTLLRAVLLVLAVNLITHPLLWWFASSTGGIGAVLVGEVAVVCVEGTIVALAVRGEWLSAYLVAALANAVSFLAGLLLLEPILSGVGSAVCC